MAKRKAPTLTRLKDVAWGLLSEYVRRKDADEGGTTQCFTCGKYIHWKYEAQAGHAIGGRRGAVLFDLEIIRPQCYPCNAKHIGNGMYHIFSAKLVREHGLEWWEKKGVNARAAVKWTRSELEDLIRGLKEKLASLGTG